MTTRKVDMILQSKPTLEGAGVRLRRAFGFGETGMFDPFLLLDDFRSDNPADYIKGFPWHPHRGIETITYLLCGEVEHGDSLGNQGVIGAGEVQWMTAGSGIIHQEMPRRSPDGRMHGFQLWANLPRTRKMMAPRYRDITRQQIPEAALPGGGTVRVICGEVQGVRGPVQDIVIEPEVLDVNLPAGAQFTHPTRPGHTVLAYVIEGQGSFGGEGDESIAANHDLLAFEDGDELRASGGSLGVRFLLISGRPLGEPIAWYGPIVMNTDEELQAAFDEYRRGTFIKT